MTDDQKPSGMAEKVVGDISKDFKVVGNSHVHGWYAWGIIGVMFGMALMVAYVSNGTGRFTPSSADELVCREAPKKVETFITGVGGGKTKEEALKNCDADLHAQFEDAHAKVVRLREECIPGSACNFKGDDGIILDCEITTSKYNEKDAWFAKSSQQEIAASCNQKNQNDAAVVTDPNMPGTTVAPDENPDGTIDVDPTQPPIIDHPPGSQTPPVVR